MGDSLHNTHMQKLPVVNETSNTLIVQLKRALTSLKTIIE